MAQPAASHLKAAASCKYPFGWETGDVRDPAQKPREQEPAMLLVPEASLPLTTHGGDPPALFLGAFRVPQGGCRRPSAITCLKSVAHTASHTEQARLP